MFRFIMKHAYKYEMGWDKVSRSQHHILMEIIQVLFKRMIYNYRTSTFWNYFVWPRFTDEGSVPEIGYDPYC